MINTNLLFLHCSLYWLPGKNGRNNLLKLNNIALNRPAMVVDQIKLNSIRNNKVDTISEIWFPLKITRTYISLQLL